MKKEETLATTQIADFITNDMSHNLLKAPSPYPTPQWYDSGLLGRLRLHACKYVRRLTIKCLSQSQFCLRSSITV